MQTDESVRGRLEVSVPAKQRKVIHTLSSSLVTDCQQFVVSSLLVKIGRQCCIFILIIIVNSILVCIKYG